MESVTTEKYLHLSPTPLLLSLPESDDDLE